MVFTPYTPIVGFKPLTQITPFTYRDGATFAEVLNRFEKWLKEIGVELETQLTNYLETVRALELSWQNAFDEFMSDVVAQLKALNDEAVAELVKDATSKLREELNKTYASKATQETVENGRLSDAELKKVFVKVNSLTRDIRDFGAVPSKTISSHAAINQAIGTGGNSVYIPEGDWCIAGTVRLRRNTKVIMHPNAVLWNDNPETEYVFINGELGNNNYASGYSGDGNIFITGGTIDNKLKLDRKIYSSCFGLAHAENVLISRVIMKNNYRSHFLEFNSMKNSHAIHCKFVNLDPDGMTNREAVNIDYAYETGFPAFGAYDNTPCDNVSVTFCEFENVNDGVGSHSWPDTLERVYQHKRIRVKFNTFRKLSGTAIHTNNWIDYDISDNSCENVDYRGIYLQRAFNGRAQDNTLVNCGIISEGAETVVFLGSGSSNNAVGNNRIYNTSPRKYHSPYRINDGVGNSIDTRGAEVGTGGALVGNVPDGNTVDGSTRYTLANNSAVGIDIFGAGAQGIIAISCLSASSNSPRGLYWVRCDSTPAFAPVAAAAADNVEYTTGALNGSTGTAGKNTLSAGTGKVYIENRSGDPKAYDVKFLTV